MKRKESRQLGRQKGLTGYCFKYIDRPFCLQSDEVHCCTFRVPDYKPSLSLRLIGSEPPF